MLSLQCSSWTIAQCFWQFKIWRERERWRVFRERWRVFRVFLTLFIIFYDKTTDKTLKYSTFFTKYWVFVVCQWMADLSSECRQRNSVSGMSSLLRFQQNNYFAAFGSKKIIPIQAYIKAVLIPDSWSFLIRVNIIQYLYFIIRFIFNISITDFLKFAPLIKTYYRVYKKK